MKKTTLAIVTALIGVCLAAPVNAATLKLNGRLDLGANYTIGQSVDIDNIDYADLDLVLTLKSNEVDFKIGTNFGIKDLFQQKFDLDLSYVSLKAPGFSFWYTSKENDWYNECFGNEQFDYERIDFPMEIGASMLGYAKQWTKLMYSLKDNDIIGRYNSLSDELIPSKFNLVSYAYPGLSLLNVETDYLYNINANFGKTSLIAYYGKQLISINNISTGLIELDQNALDYKGNTSTEYSVYTGIIRTNSNLFGNFYLGSLVSFGFIKNDIGYRNEGAANLGLDLSYKFNNGGEISLAGIATFNLRGIRDAFSDLSSLSGQVLVEAFKPVKKGYAYIAEISNIALDDKGNYRIGLNYSDVQNNAIVPNGVYEYRFTPGTRAFGSNFGVAIDALGQPVTLSIDNLLVWKWDDVDEVYEIARDIITFTGNVKLNGNYSISTKLQPTIFINSLYLKSSTTFELAFSGKLDERFSLSSNINLITTRTNSLTAGYDVLTNYSATVIGNYQEKFGTIGLVKSSYIEASAMIGIANSFVNPSSPNPLSKPMANIYFKAGAFFDNNFSLDLAGFASYNSIYGSGFRYVNGASENLQAVLTSTLRWYFNPVACLYLTGTYRNWWGVPADSNRSSVYGELGLRVKTDNDIFVQLSIGNDGLADESKLEGKNAMPWSALEVIPENMLMSVKLIQLKVSLKF